MAMMLEQLDDDELEGFLKGARALHRARKQFHQDLPTPPPEAGR
jgi:hypothetical protein